MEINNISLHDLIIAESMLSNELDIFEKISNCYRGYDYDKWNKDQIVYYNDSRHKRLKNIRNLIKQKLKFYGNI